VPVQSARPFVILTAPRSGSAWLVDVLNSHPRIVAYGELFVPEAHEREGAYGTRDRPLFTNYAEMDGRGRSRLGLLRKRIAYLNAVYDRDDADCVGFKLVYKQATVNPGVLTYLALRRAKAVHLIRSNVLDSVISWETARARRLFHARKGDEVKPIEVELDTATLLDRLDHHEYAITVARGWIRNLRLPYTETFYEELTGPKRNEKLGRILSFLGVEPSALGSDFVRMNPADHRQLLANYDEVRDTLSGSRFEWMLR
jgi:LPS sulfotransferase NodH